jgi:NADPH:quinone reductase-like Zn-dependent oxidoreductase
MKAVVYNRYGSPDVLQFKEIAKPTPKNHEVLIKVHATTVTSADWRARTLDVPRGFGPMARLFFGISGPRQPILGTEMAGEIESIGKGVSVWKAGDHVVAFTGARMGCHAEYMCMAESGYLARKPANLTFEEAAGISFGGMAALAFFKRARIQKGDKVLVNGASGAVGTAAVQLAKHFGAEVSDFTQSGETYDIIVDTAGTAPFSRSKGSLKEGGRLLLVLGTLPDLLMSPWAALTSSKKVIAGPTGGAPEDVRFLARLAEAGQLKPVIDRQYPFEQIAEAHRHVDKGHKRGTVVVTVAP